MRFFQLHDYVAVDYVTKYVAVTGMDPNADHPLAGIKINKPEINDIEPLRAEIEAFLPKRGIKETTFGRLAVNDGKFVQRLRTGQNMTLATIEKAHAFIRDSLTEKAA